jgi:hypothetical protein
LTRAGEKLDLSEFLVKDDGEKEGYVEHVCTHVGDRLTPLTRTVTMGYRCPH